MVVSCFCSAVSLPVTRQAADLQSRSLNPAAISTGQLGDFGFKFIAVDPRRPPASVSAPRWDVCSAATCCLLVWAFWQTAVASSWPYGVLSGRIRSHEIYRRWQNSKLWCKRKLVRTNSEILIGCGVRSKCNGAVSDLWRSERFWKSFAECIVNDQEGELPLRASA
jgi:hypothetical protein